MKEKSFITGNGSRSGGWFNGSVVVAQMIQRRKRILRQKLPQTMLMPRKRLTARKQKIQVKILQVLIPLKKTVRRQMTQLQKQRVQVRILQVVIQQKQTVQRWPTARRQKQQEVLLVQQPRLQTVMHTAGLVSAAGWNITVEDVEINSSLENVSVELGYTGVETSDYKKEADAGKTFCMIKLKIEKDGSKETLDWANLKLTDSEGNEYSRMDDEFISELV